MFGLLKWPLVLCLALGITNVAQPQSQQPRVGRDAALLLRVNESVQKELKITDAQKTKLKDEIEKAAGDIKTVDEVITKILNEKQVTRLKQIALQHQMQITANKACQNPEIQSKLNLTDDQKEKITKIGEESSKKKREIGTLFVRGGSTREETLKKDVAVNKETMEKVIGVLTANQKKTWYEMTGKPFFMRGNPLRRANPGKK